MVTEKRTRESQVFHDLANKLMIAQSFLMEVEESGANPGLLSSELRRSYDIINRARESSCDCWKSEFEESIVRIIKTVQSMRSLNDSRCLKYFEDFLTTFFRKDPSSRSIKVMISELLPVLERLASPTYLGIFYTTNPGFDNTVDPEIEDLMINLVKNSIEARASIISIYVAVKHDHLVLIFDDDGIGVDPRILKLLKSGCAVSQKGPGRGLGLQSVRHFVDQREGFFEISSALGEGTRIVLSIPLFQEP
ncbi:hypothetical protein KC644_04345 [Candidatus Berkelbacteria bacterium]|nr:hypothetical protein [Candidatus Berkelbacteria bacterium]